MKGFKTLLEKKDKAQKKSTKKYIDDKTIFHVFKQVIKEDYGLQGADNVVPEFYKERIIFISFKKSIWAQEVWMRREDIINRVNNYCNAQILKELKVK